jgi:hypothetical protein
MVYGGVVYIHVFEVYVRWFGQDTKHGACLQDMGRLYRSVPVINHHEISLNFMFLTWKGLGLNFEIVGERRDEELP